MFFYKKDKMTGRANIVRRFFEKIPKKIKLKSQKKKHNFSKIFDFGNLKRRKSNIQAICN